VRQGKVDIRTQAGIKVKERKKTSGGVDKDFGVELAEGVKRSGGGDLPL